MTLSRRLLAEFLGTAFLLIAVVGSGIMGERLAGGNDAITLLANSLATGGALVALILAFGPISGAHFNPAVSIALAARGEFSWKDVPSYAGIQIVGAILGVAVAQAMFGLPLLEFSTKARPGLNLMWSEFIATFGLLAVIISGVRFRPGAVPYAVAAYITGAYWFTSSTSFANPAVAIAREFTNTFAGIRPEDVLEFIVAQALATAVAVAVFAWLIRSEPGRGS
jgi:glycerol uptake facilitator-like aquaporin